MGSPDVSIVTAAYNAAAYIERALESVRRGTIDRSRVEHIVVDDASTDGTAAIADAFDAPMSTWSKTNATSAEPKPAIGVSSRHAANTS